MEQENLIDYKTAVLAKELGYNIPTLIGITSDGTKLQAVIPHLQKEWIQVNQGYYSCPLKEELQTWINTTFNLFPVKEGLYECMLRIKNNLQI